MVAGWVRTITLPVWKSSDLAVEDLRLAGRFGMRESEMDRDPYRRIAKWYDRVLEPMNTPLRAIAMKMLPSTTGIAVLDVGCGTGSFLTDFADAGCRAFGLDASPAMLEQAGRRLVSRADLCLGDATRLPYDRGSFDLIVAAMVLHELDEAIRIAVLDEMTRTLKPDGRVLVIDFNSGGLRARGLLTRSLSLVAEVVAGRTHFRNFRSFMAIGGLPALLRRSDLTIDRERNVAGGNMGLYVLRSANAAGDA